MSSLVFGCPNCQQPFQVAATQAGQVVQCPSCAQTVEIPASAFGDAPQPPPQPAPEEPIVFACPSCQGQFGITSSMDGQNVACPHCQAPTLIQFSVQTTEPETEPAEIGPSIKTDMPISKKQKREIKKRAKSKLKSKANKDLFAPGAIPETAKPEPDAPEPAKSEPSPEPKDARLDSPKPQPDTAATHDKPEPSPVPTKKAASPVVPKPPVKAKRRSPSPPESPAVEPGSPTVDEPSTESNVQTAQAPAPPGAMTEQVEPPVVEADEVTTPEPAPEDHRKSIAHLLPPKFSVLDPSRLRVSGGENFKVLLPDGKGGTAQMDNRILHVKHGDETVSLVTLTPKQKARRRLIQNIIAILIGIAVMAIAFTILM